MSLRVKIGGMFLAFAAIMGLGAAPASAVTVYHSNSYWKYTSNTAVKYCWNDYNWWEETFQFKKDRYEPCGWRVL